MRLQIAIIYGLLIILSICFWIQADINNEDEVRITKFEHELHQLRIKVGEIKDVHVCEDRSHETCDGDCDCDGVACDTL